MVALTIYRRDDLSSTVINHVNYQSLRVLRAGIVRRAFAVQGESVNDKLVDEVAQRSQTQVLVAIKARSLHNLLYAAPDQRRPCNISKLEHATPALGNVFNKHILGKGVGTYGDDIKIVTRVDHTGDVGTTVDFEDRVAWVPLQPSYIKSVGCSATIRIAQAATLEHVTVGGAVDAVPSCL